MIQNFKSNELLEQKYPLISWNCELKEESINSINCGKGKSLASVRRNVLEHRPTFRVTDRLAKITLGPWGGGPQTGDFRRIPAQFLYSFSYV